MATLKIICAIQLLYIFLLHYVIYHNRKNNDSYIYVLRCYINGLRSGIKSKGSTNE